MDNYDAEEAGFLDGEFDAQCENAEYTSYGASIDLDELDDDARDDYEQAYFSAYDSNKN